MCGFRGMSVESSECCECVRWSVVNVSGVNLLNIKLVFKQMNKLKNNELLASTFCNHVYNVERTSYAQVSV